MDDEKIQLILTAVDNMSATVDNVSKKIEGMQKSTSAAEDGVKALSGAFQKYLAPAAIIGGLVAVVKEAMGSEEAVNSLSIAVEQAGGSWSKTGGEMQAYATKLQSMTKYSDEEVMDVMKRLISYTGDSTQSWKYAGLAMDIASSGMMGAEGASKAISFALEGNVNALGKLMPELKGVDAELLKNMTQTERSTYALDLLSERFGGRAAKEANTLQGQLKQLWNQISDVAEILGGILIPVLSLGVTWLKNIVVIVGKVVTAIRDFLAPVIQALGKIFGPMIKQVDTATKGFQEFFTNLTKETPGAEYDLKKIGAAYQQTQKTGSNAFSQLTKDQKEARDKIIKDQEEQLQTEMDAYIKHYEEAAQAQEKFNADYILKTQGRTAADMFELDKQYAYYQKYNLDKNQLDTWYDASKKAIDDAANKKREEDTKKEIADNEAKYKRLGDIFQNDFVDRMQKNGNILEAFVFALYDSITAEFLRKVSDPLIKYCGIMVDAYVAMFQAFGTVAWKGMEVVSKWVYDGMVNVLNYVLSGKLAEILAGAWAAVASIWSWAWANSLWTFGGSLAAGAAAVAGLWAAVNGIIGTVKSIKLAEGGIATKATLATIGEGGEPEAVLPLSKLDAMLSGGSGRGLTINISDGAFVLNGINWTNEGQKKEVARELSSYILQYVEGGYTSTRGVARRI